MHIHSEFANTDYVTIRGARGNIEAAMVWFARLRLLFQPACHCLLIVANMVLMVCLGVAKAQREWTRSSVVVRPKKSCLLYTSDAADERSSVDLGGRRII